MIDDKMARYNALDALHTLAIAKKLLPLAKEDANYQKMYKWTLSLYNPLMYMMSIGVKVNIDELEKTKIRIINEKDKIKLEIWGIVGYEININSPKQLCNYFYIEKKITPYTNNKDGRKSITCDDMALTRLARGTASRKGLKEAILIKRYRGLSKLYGTYLDMNLDKDNRIRCQYKPRGTNFSRLSSAKTIWETGMNMQNLPQEFKGFLVSDPGYVLVEVDKRQAEWIVVAYLSNEENMIRVIEENGDAHAHTAIQFLATLGYKMPLDVLVEEQKKGQHSTDQDSLKKVRESIDFFKDYDGWLPRNMTLRQMGKKSNHGLNYMEGFKRFALVNDIPESDAKMCIDCYFKIYPGIPAWHEMVRQQLLSNRTIHDLCDRKYRFLDRYDTAENLLRQAISYAPQSTVGMITNNALIAIYNANAPYMQHIQLLAQVHDSILFQYPLSKLPDLSKALVDIKEILEPELKARGNTFKIPTDMTIGMNWKDMIPIKLNDNSTEVLEALKVGVLSLDS